MEYIRVLEHPSDIGIEVHGLTLEELFRNAAYGMYCIMFGGPYESNREYVIQVSLKSTDPERLLVQWLNELLYYFETSGFIFIDASFEELSGTSLKSRIFGAPLLHANLEVCVGIKAVTYHRLLLERRNELWYAQVYFDV
ncbi:MAG: archease [Bacteroidetes bacterium]|nr:archease [Bacteroidota bacterium]